MNWEAWKQSAIALWQGVRLADLLDVFVVAVFVYAALVWLRRSRSRVALAGFALLALVYLAAKLLGMYLTLSIFQMGVTVALVGLVVIFQEEIRRGFERLATGARLGPKQIPLAASDWSDILVESAASLAEKHIGALIVVKGKEPLLRHATGGITLDGRLSEALLYSIFDPGSIGHDGAAIIEGDRVVSFGAHLPLSTNVGGREKFGTRHTAALGLSERSDALVIVVSEERGEMSLAREGKLEKMGAASELKEHLDEFVAVRAEEAESGTFSKLLTKHVPLKLLSLLIAGGTWLAAFGFQSEVIARTFDVPIVIRNVPNGWMIDDPKPHRTQVTLSGTNRAFRVLDPGNLSISLDVEEVQPGWQSVAVVESDVSHPRDLTVEHIDADAVRLQAYPTTIKKVRVRPITEGKLAPGVSFLGLDIRPEQVPVLVRQADAHEVHSVRTEPIDLGEMKSTSTVQVPLDFRAPTRPAPDGPQNVDVTVRVRSPPEGK